MSKDRQIRRAQTVSPFGVGAIYDIGDESLVSCDISRWGKNGTPIRLKRLERPLRVSGFRMAPAPRGSLDRYPPRIPYYRFPQWMFCPSCRYMVRWSTRSEQRGEPPRCQGDGCKGRVLVPMRFVVACERGHLGDVPWDFWAHLGADVVAKGRCQKPRLRFESRPGRGSGLGSLVVRCVVCKSERSLQGITSVDLLDVFNLRCCGRQPWQRSDDAIECDASPKILQRGASNVYYPAVVSGIDIPLDAVEGQLGGLREEIMSHPNFTRLKTAFESSSGLNNPLVDAYAQVIADGLGCEPSQVTDVLSETESAGGGASEVPFSDEGLLREEWPHLVTPPETCDSSAAFIADRIDLSKVEDSFGLLKLIENIVLVHRLREVRALRGFHRVRPGPAESMVRADLGRGVNFLPGMEVFGEGIFVEFSESALARWSEVNAQALDARIKAVHARWAGGNFTFLPEPTGRRILLHTFAHLLIRQLSFDCGYSASSLRERLYVAEAGAAGGAMAGLLIYTADSDSEGSLGGLVRQGHPERLLPSIVASLRSATWCSSDPICRETDGQGLGGMNRAACHGCALVSETSCVHGNTLLDRTLAVGGGDGVTGFFEPVLNSVLGVSAK